MIDSIAVAIYQRLKPYVVPLILLSSLFLVVGVSINEANWVEQDNQVVQWLWIAILLGWLLARSRFSGLFVTFYSLLIMLLASLQITAQVIPFPRHIFSGEFWGWVNGMNLRWVKFTLRVGGWVEVLQNGKKLEDTGLFLILMVLVVWGSVFWLMWWMLRKRRVFVGLLPLAFWMVVNVHLSRQPLANYFFFLLFAFLLLAREAFFRQHRDWEVRRVDYPDQLGVEWGVSAILVAVVVLLAGRLGTVVATPEGWELISEWVRSRQQETSERAEQLFAGVNTPPPAPEGIAKPRVYANTPNLGEIGSPLPQGTDTIMWVRTSDPPPVLQDYAVNNIPDIEIKGHYWRSSVYDVYTGRGWEVVPPNLESVPLPKDAAVPGEEAPDGHYYLRQDFDVEAIYSGSLFAVNEPVNPGPGTRLRAASGPEGGMLLEGRVSNYSVVSEATRVTGDELASAGTDYPEAVLERYLQLPDGLPQRVTSLADRVAGAGATPFHQAVLIQNYLRLNYPYNLKSRLAPPDRDVVDYFLFDAEEGFCTHYASAMVVMLRSQGVPARMATGYATGAWNPSRGAYQVMVSSAHAWVEVYFPGYGWIEFEPTAYQSPFDYPERGRSTANVPSAGPAQPKPPDLSPYLLPMLGVVVVVVVLLGLPFLLLRVFRTTRGDPAQQVDALYHQMRRALGWAGLGSEASVTPDEYLARYRQELSPYARIQQALRRSTDLYRQVLYSPRPPQAADARIAADLWRGAVQEWVVLWAKDRWRRVKERNL